MVAVEDAKSPEVGCAWEDPRLLKGVLVVCEVVEVPRLLKRLGCCEVEVPVPRLLKILGWPCVGEAVAFRLPKSPPAWGCEVEVELPPRLPKRLDIL